MAEPSSSFDLFQWLPADVGVAFEHVARRRRFVLGEIIYSQGEPGDQMFRLAAGAVRLSVARSDGRELLYCLFEPGDCFGTSSLVDGEPRPQSAAALEDCEVQVLGKPGFDELRKQHRSFDDALLRLATRHMRLLSSFFADAHLEAMAARVASRIIAAAKSFGRPTEGGIALSIRLSQAHLALMVGGSRQTVNKVLQQFQKENLINLKYGRLVIHSISGLEAKLNVL